MIKKRNCEKTITTENGWIDKVTMFDKNSVRNFLILIKLLIFFKIQKKTNIFKSWKKRAKQIIRASFEIQIKKTLKLKRYITKLAAEFFKKNLDKIYVINIHKTPKTIWNIFDAATEYSNKWKYKFNI